jgi:hypothetical protein
MIACFLPASGNVVGLAQSDLDCVRVFRDSSCGRETSFGWPRHPKGMRSISCRLTASACSVESPIMGGRSRTNADNGSKGQENRAQALARVGQRKDVKPCKGGRTHAPINFRHSIYQKERHVVSHFQSPNSRPYRAITVGGRATLARAKVPRPFGPPFIARPRLWLSRAPIWLR